MFIEDTRRYYSFCIFNDNLLKSCNYIYWKLEFCSNRWWRLFLFIIIVLKTIIFNCTLLKKSNRQLSSITHHLTQCSLLSLCKQKFSVKIYFCSCKALINHSKVLLPHIISRSVIDMIVFVESSFWWSIENRLSFLDDDYYWIILEKKRWYIYDWRVFE